MRLRIFAPSSERPAPGERWHWMLLDARREVLREEFSALAGIPRVDEAELVLPMARVLFARLKLPRVGGATLREILPYAVEDRLLGDPAHVHAVAGMTDRNGETLVAVIDREWLAAVLEALREAGIRPAKAWCESALLAREAGEWNLVLGAARGILVDDSGAGVAFDRAASAEAPLALRIALDEASARGDRPERILVHSQDNAPLPDLARWSAEAGVALEAGTSWEALARGAPARAAIDLLPREWSNRRATMASLRIPRAALVLLVAIVALQLALDAARTWSLSRERNALAAKAEATFRSAFPEARSVVDPRLQMERNLAELRRSRGLASDDDFLARLTAAARGMPGPVHAVEYANGRLEVRRDASAAVAEAR